MRRPRALLTPSARRRAAVGSPGWFAQHLIELRRGFVLVSEHLEDGGLEIGIYNTCRANSAL